LLSVEPTRDELWNNLAYFESPSVLNKVGLVGHPPRKMPQKTSKRVSAYVRQGREYLELAETSPELIRPLINYYGVLSLVRGLLSMGSQGRQWFQPGRGHGATFHDASRIAKGMDHLLETVITIQDNGTIGEAVRRLPLSRSIEIFSSKEARESFNRREAPSGWRSKVRGHRLAAGKFQFTLGQLLSRLPDLRHLFELSTGEKSALEAAVVTKRDDLIDPRDGELPEIELLVELLVESRRLRSDTSDSKDSLVELENRLGFGPEVEWIRYDIDEHPFTVFPCLSIRADSQFVPLPIALVSDKAGQPSIPHALGGAWNLSDGHIFLTILYAASMMSRYHPVEWMSLWHGHADSPSAPLFRVAVNVATDGIIDLVLRTFDRLIEENRFSRFALIRKGRVEDDQ
jgi:hypothetical protein